MSYRLYPEQESNREGFERVIHESVKKTRAKTADKRQRMLEVAPKGYATTADEWWAIVDVWWTELYEIMQSYLPMNSYGKPYSQEICEETAAVRIVRYREQHDRELHSYLDVAWAAAPDHGSIHAIPGWDVLCDLCSEGGVLFEGDTAEENGQ